VFGRCPVTAGCRPLNQSLCQVLRCGGVNPIRKAGKAWPVVIGGHLLVGGPSGNLFLVATIGGSPPVAVGRAPRALSGPQQLWLLGGEGVRH
jgi:hypothetical protein